MVESTFCDWKHTIRDDKLTGASCPPIDEVNTANFFFQISLSSSCQINKSLLLFFSAHVRTGSTGSLSNSQLNSQGNDICSIASSSQEEMRCYLEQQHQGHQQLITCMNVVGNTVLTGSQDHTLKVCSICSDQHCFSSNKFSFLPMQHIQIFSDFFFVLQVFKLDLANLVFTLHGHYGPITSIFIDHYQSCTGGSGSQDGLLCVWDLITGACMYSIQAHDGAIVSLICSSSYVISMGTDERLYIWERFQGNLLNTINVPYVYSSLLMLTPSLLITAKPGKQFHIMCITSFPS